MIKVVMVYVDGTDGDILRIAAAESLVNLFDAHVIALFLNPMPKIMPSDGGVATQLWTNLADLSHEAGDQAEAALAQRLSKLKTTSEIRRIDVYFDEEADGVAAREARAADVFVALRLGAEEVPGMTDDVVEDVLFGSGRHLFLVTEAKSFAGGFEHSLLAWDGGREAARAMAEAMPYLQRSRRVSVVVVVDEAGLPDEATSGDAAVDYLTRHGVPANLKLVEPNGRQTAAVLIEEAGQLNADLIVAGGYGHSRLRERILGGVTYQLLHTSPIPLVVAH